MYRWIITWFILSKIVQLTTWHEGRTIGIIIWRPWIFQYNLFTSCEDILSWTKDLDRPTDLPYMSSGAACQADYTAHEPKVNFEWWPGFTSLLSAVSDDPSQQHYISSPPGNVLLALSFNCWDCGSYMSEYCYNVLAGQKNPAPHIFEHLCTEQHLYIFVNLP